MTPEAYIEELKHTIKTMAEAHHAAFETEKAKKDYFLKDNQSLKAELERADDKIDQLTAQLAQAQAACDVKDSALESGLAAVWDGYYSGKGVEIAYAQAVDKQIKDALKGKSSEGWLSPDEAAKLQAQCVAKNAAITNLREQTANPTLPRFPDLWSPNNAIHIANLESALAELQTQLAQALAENKGLESVTKAKEHALEIAYRNIMQHDAEAAKLQEDLNWHKAALEESQERELHITPARAKELRELADRLTGMCGTDDDCEQAARELRRMADAEKGEK